MRSVLFSVIVAVGTSAVGCLPNPQSEWVTSEGSEQRSTLSDATFESVDVDCEFVSDGGGWLTRYFAHPHVVHVAHVGGGHSRHFGRH